MENEEERVENMMFLQSLIVCNNKYIMCVIIYIACNSDCLLTMVSPTDSESESGCHLFASMHSL